MIVEDIRDFFRAQAVAPYQDEHVVRQMTDYIVQRGHSILQIHKLDKNDHAHVCGLLNIYAISRYAMVLDAGCGIGGVARIMREIRPDLDFTLVNISRAQLEHCRDFDTILADFHNIPVPGGFFDAIMFNYSLGHGLLDLAMFEAARVVKPGGLLLIYDLGAEDSSRLIEVMGYKAHQPRRVVEAAHAAGFALNHQIIPRTTDTTGALDLMAPDQFARTFAGVMPVIYRFVRQKEFDARQP